VGPRPGTLSPWSSKAPDIARNGVGTTMPASPLSASQGLALGQWLLDTFGG
jgi:hypothetical protein